SSSNPTLRGAASWLRRQQNADGGFGFGGRGGGSDVDDTAAVLQALVDAGARGPAIGRSSAFLVRSQNPDGGYPQQAGGESIAPVRGHVAATVTARAAPAAVARHRPAVPRSRPRGGAVAAGIAPAAGQRVNRLARSIGALLGSVLAPMLR